VDYHFASHYHADHIGCLDDLAAAGITIAIAGYDRAYSYTTLTYQSYVNTLGAKRQTIAKGQTITLDADAPQPVTIRCIDVNGAGVYPPTGSDENPKSAVYRIEYGTFREVIGGDLTGSSFSADVEAVVGPEVGDVDVYRVHHHGSRYSTNDAWLTAVTPEVAVVSVGDGNPYGHPTADAMNRLHNHGVRVYWTETGTGAVPNPLWDTVAHGTITVDCCAHAAPADTFRVSGPGFTHPYAIAASTSVPDPLPAGALRLDVDRTIVGPEGVRFLLAGASFGDELALVDVRGRTVRTLLVRDGRAAWDGTDAYGRGVPASLYIAVVRAADGRTATRRLAVVR
jgi:hypothetical protein